LLKNSIKQSHPTILDLYPASWSAQNKSKCITTLDELQRYNDSVKFNTFLFIIFGQNIMYMFLVPIHIAICGISLVTHVTFVSDFTVCLLLCLTWVCSFVDNFELLSCVKERVRSLESTTVRYWNLLLQELNFNAMNKNDINTFIF